MASAIPRARLVALDSDNHIVLADEPAWDVFMAEVTAFLELDRVAAGFGTAPARATTAEPLTEREIDVLRLAAQGLDNAAIAEHLTVSVRTVERHLSNTDLKLGVSGKAARVAAVAHLLSHGSSSR